MMSWQQSRAIPRGRRYLRNFRNTTQLSFVRPLRLLSIRMLTHRVCEGMLWVLPDATSPIRFRLPQTFVKPQRHRLNFCKSVMGLSFFDDAHANIVKNGNTHGGRTFRCEENWAVGVAVVTCLSNLQKRKVQ